MVLRLPADGVLQGVHLGRGLRDGDAGFETSNADVVLIALDFRKLFGIPAEGDEGFDGMIAAGDPGVREIEGRGKHTDDGVGTAIERDGATDYAGVGVEAATPQTFGDDDDIMAGLIFHRQKRAAEDGLHAEQREEIRRVLRDGDDLRLSAATERE